MNIHSIEVSKLATYALSPFLMDHTLIAKKYSSDTIGLLEIKIEDDSEVSGDDIDKIIEQEIFCFILYRYIELLFQSKLIQIEVISGEYGTGLIKYSNFTIPIIIAYSEHEYQQIKKTIDNQSFQGGDSFVAYIPMESIRDMRNRVECYIESKNKGIKTSRQFIQDALRSIETRILFEYNIEIDSTGPNSGRLLNLLASENEIIGKRDNRSKKGKKKK